MVGALRLLGATDRQIEAACHVTRRSIPVILADLEKTGRVTPLKDRLALLIGDNAERAAIALRELLDQAVDEPASIELAGMIKAVATAVGITVEKHALLTGGATERIETMVGAGRGEIEAWAREFAIPVESVSRPVDTPSAANPSLSAQTNTLPPMRHTADTSASLTSPNAPTPAADPTRSEATGADPGGGAFVAAGIAGKADESMTAKILFYDAQHSHRLGGRGATGHRTERAARTAAQPAPDTGRG